MMIASSWRGHVIVWCDDHWEYEDTGVPTTDMPERACGNCQLKNRPDGHDACLGSLPGVTNACCGHGNRNESFIQFENGFHIKGFIIDTEGKE